MKYMVYGFLASFTTCVLMVVLTLVLLSSNFELNRQKCGDYGYWHCLIKGNRP